MTTHELASLLDHLRAGLSAGLKEPACRAFSEAADAFRELPDQPLKALAKTLRAQSGSGTARSKAVVDVSAVVARLREVRAGAAAGTLADEIGHLTVPQLKDVLKAFGQKGTTTRDGNVGRVLALLRAQGEGPATAPYPQVAADPYLVEQGVKTFLRLRDARDLSIGDVRGQFEPIRLYPKAVVEEISRQLGYTPGDTREDTVNRLLSDLVGIKMNQRSGESILSGV